MVFGNVPATGPRVELSRHRRGSSLSLPPLQQVGFLLVVHFLQVRRPCLRRVHQESH